MLLAARMHFSLFDYFAGHFSPESLPLYIIYAHVAVYSNELIAIGFLDDSRDGASRLCNAGFAARRITAIVPGEAEIR